MIVACDQVEDRVWSSLSAGCYRDNLLKIMPIIVLRYFVIELWAEIMGGFLLNNF